MMMHMHSSDYKRKECNGLKADFDALVVGAGLAGSVVARRLAEKGWNVLVIDRRPHVAGNAFDRIDSHGVLIHEYGPHIFHTSDADVFRWLSMFTDWRFYEHRVLASVDGQLLPIPINRTTINHLYGLDLDEKGVADFLEGCRETREKLLTSEDVVLSSVGRELCEKFFSGYTRKQWGLELSQLSAGVAARIPTRTNDDDRYFTDTYQMMPLDGYASMTMRMLAHPGIRLELNREFNKASDMAKTKTLVYTGPIDEYFDYRFGRLPYRSLRFEHTHIPDIDRYQKVGTVNYPNENEFTRITEFRHLTGQRVAGTSIVKEFSQSAGDPYYPIPNRDNELLYRKYREHAEREHGVFFVGRLAEYRYYNMDQVVKTALHVADSMEDLS